MSDEADRSENGPPATRNGKLGKIKIPFRKNVLLLVLSGYATLLLMFAFAVGLTDAITAREAYDMLEGPLMALIGGSLAISKDLVPLSDT